MKKTDPRKNREKKTNILRMIEGILSVVTLLFLFSTLTMIRTEDPDIDSGIILVCILLSLSYALQAAAAYKADRMTFVKNIVFSAMYAAVWITVAVMDVCTFSSVMLLEVFLLVILINRITAAISARKVRSRIINILLALAVAALVLSAMLQNDTETTEYLMSTDILLTGKVLGHIIAISFSQMRFGVLRKILRKTFAAEILFGLILLILSFSFVFQSFEPGIENYYDALWYCFAVVTTIGFGDMVVTSPVSRMLSVILGIYGIVVVAMITSVIVNFYIEVKDEKAMMTRTRLSAKKHRKALPKRAAKRISLLSLTTAENDRYLLNHNAITNNES